jgi:hypothetical protein
MTAYEMKRVTTIRLSASKILALLIRGAQRYFAGSFRGAVAGADAAPGTVEPGDT